MSPTPPADTRAEARAFLGRYGHLIGFCIVAVMAIVGLYTATHASTTATDAAHDAKRSADSAAEIAVTAKGMAIQNRHTLTQLKRERTERTRAVGGVIFLGCSRDNKQDLLLGTLIAGSLRASQNRRFSAAQQKIVNQYRRKLRDLQKVPVCADVVKGFLREAGAPPSLGAAPLQPPNINQKHPKSGK